MNIGSTVIKSVKLGLTNINKIYIGLELIFSYLSNIILDFKTRVLSDSGIFENELYLENFLSNIDFNNSKFLITPNGYKLGKLYSLKPNDGSLDLNVVRNTIATRINEFGILELVNENYLRIDYSNGVGVLLIEPQRTNLITNSDGNLSTYLSNSGNVSNASIPLNGFSNSIQFGNNSIATFSYKRNFTPIIGVQYVLSIFVQMDDNSLPLLGLTSTTGDFSLIIAGARGNVNPEVNRIGNTNIYRVSVALTATSATNSFGVIKYTGQSSKGFRFTGIQLEIDSKCSSYIPTMTSEMTRDADVISKTGLSGITSITEYFENGTTNIISGSPTSYTMSQGRIKNVISV